MRCLICKNGEMRSSTGTYFAKMKNCYVIIENVPCHKCEQCGEIVYSASVMERLEEILDSLEKVASKIFIMDFQKAA